MSEAWPALCTLIGLILLLALIIRGQLSAFVAMVVVSIGIGLAAGMSPSTVVETVSIGVGGIMKEVAIILALGAMLGRILEASGGAEAIAQKLIDALGQKRASLALVFAAYLVGLPILFNVGFLVLVPIVYRLQKQTGQSLLYFLLPVAFSLGITHSLVPPHPGIVGAVQFLSGEKAPPPLAGSKGAVKTEQPQAAPPVEPLPSDRQPTPPNQVMVQTILFGALMSLPLCLFGWLVPGRWWAAHQHVENPEQLAGTMTTRTATAPASFPAALCVVTLPLVLSFVGFGSELLERLGHLPEFLTQPLVAKDEVEAPLMVLTHAPLAWLRFLGTPTMALLVPTGLAFWLLGVRQGMNRSQLAKIADRALQDVGSILFLFGAAGGFKEVIVQSGAGAWIAQAVNQLPISRVASAYLVAAMVRVALGSATASILTASSLLADVARSMPGQETLLVLAVANGVTFMTQPADSGFWMIKEYGNLSVRDVMVKFNICRISMSLLGLALLLLYEAWLM
jgi:Gnt-I system low-affinity gluconate transporter